MTKRETARERFERKLADWMANAQPRWVPPKPRLRLVTRDGHVVGDAIVDAEPEPQLPRPAA